MKFQAHDDWMARRAIKNVGTLLMACLGCMVLFPALAADAGAARPAVLIRVVACPAEDADSAAGYYFATCAIKGRARKGVRVSGISTGIGRGREVRLVVTDKAGAWVMAKAVVGAGGAWVVEGLDLSRLANGVLAIVAETADKQGKVVSDKASGELKSSGTIQSVRFIAGTNRYDIPKLIAEDRVDLYRRDAHEIGIGGVTEDIRDGSTVAIEVRDVHGARRDFEAVVHDDRWLAPGLNLSALATGPLTVAVRVSEGDGHTVAAPGTELAAILDDPVDAVPARPAWTLTGQGTGLHKAVRAALDYDSRLYGAHWGAEAARVNVALARRAYLPQVTLSAGASVEKYDYTKGGTNTERNETGQYGISASWRVFDFGASQRRVSAALSRQESEALREERMRDIVTFDLVSAYMDVYRVRKLLDINQKNRVAHRDLSEIVQARVKQGLGSEVRLKEAMLRLQDIEMEREDLIQQSKDAGEAYRLLTGDLPDDVFSEIEGARKLPRFSDDSIETLIAEATERHPELAAARNEIDAEGHDIEALHRQHLPAVDLNLGYSRLVNPAPKAASYWDPKVGVTLTWQLFGNLVNQQVSQAVAKREQQLANYNRLMHETERNVRTGADSILSTRARLDQIAASTRSAAEVANLRLQQFKTQTMSDDSVLAMSNAFNQRFRAEASELNVRLKGVLAEYGLESNVGLLRLEFADPLTGYEDKRSVADMPMTVPEYRDRKKFRFDQDVPRRYERLPQASPENRLGREQRDSDCLYCASPDARH